MSVSDLESRIANLARWTPEHVVERLKEAYDVLRRTPSRIGPKQLTSAWPTHSDLTEGEEFFIALEFAARTDYIAAAELKLLKAERQAEAEARAEQAREIADKKVDVPTAAEASRCEEAIGWPLSHLQPFPLQGDALGLFCRCAALQVSLERSLRARREIADDLVEHRREEIRLEERRDKLISEELRKRTAKIDPMVARRQAEEDAAKASVIAWAVERFAIGEPKPSTKTARVTRDEVWPGRVFTRRALDKYRKEGAVTIATALNRDRVRVR